MKQENSAVKNWLKAFRLRTLPLAFSVIIAGSAIAMGPNFSITIFALTLTTTLFLQILSNLANDYGDFVKGTDNDERIGPERSLQSGAITKTQMKNAIILFSGLALASGTLLLISAFTFEEIRIAGLFLLIGLICIGAAIKYTVGKNAYGYKAMGDIAVFIFFGVIGVGGTFYLQTKTIEEYVVLPVMMFGLWCTAVLNLNNMRDVDNDIAHNKKTMAYYLGFNGAKVYHLALLIVPYGLLLFATAHDFQLKSLVAFSVFPLTLIQMIAVIKAEKRSDFDKWLKIQAISTLLNSFAILFYLYLQNYE